VSTTDATQTVEQHAASLPAGSWQIVPAESELGFSTRMFGLIPVRGRYGRFAGELQIDDAAQASGSLRIETATLTTGIGKRDAHLRSEDFFAAEAHPLMSFELSGIELGAEGTGTATGTLHIRDAELGIEAPVTVAAQGADRLRIDGHFEVDHASSSLGWKRVPGSVQVTAALALERAR
jgi:polyisoprenoid-binding protein YceI